MRRKRIRRESRVTGHDGRISVGSLTELRPSNRPVRFTTKHTRFRSRHFSRTSLRQLCQSESWRKEKKPKKNRKSSPTSLLGSFYHFSFFTQNETGSICQTALRSRRISEQKSDCRTHTASEVAMQLNKTIKTSCISKGEEGGRKINNKPKLKVCCVLR